MSPPPSKENSPRTATGLSRPAAIARTSSADDSTVNTGNTSGSSHGAHGNIISRPSLLAGLNAIRLPEDPESSYTTVAPPRPRRLWKVSDTAIPSVPDFYPPLDRRCTAHVSDAPPSVVAVRISEALRLRGVSAEYDEEAVTATCMTVDRCHFVVHLWRERSRSGNTTGSPMNTISLDGVLVECIRVRGSVLTFHRTVQAVLQAAKSHDSGRDVRPARQLAPTEWGRLSPAPTAATAAAAAATDTEHKTLTPPTKSAKTLSHAALEALEHALHLLRKDRLQPQILGMESLVALTDPETSGIDTAMYAALAILGAPVTEGLSPDSAYFLTEIHQLWIMQVLVERVVPGEAAAEAAMTTATPDVSFSFSSCPTSLLGTGDSNKANNKTNNSNPDANESSATEMDELTVSHGSLGDEHHGGMIRALALRALSNALTVLDRHQPKILSSVLSVQCPHLTATPLLRTLLEDMQGAHRPPAVVAGTRLASQHEAVLAIRCLRLLGTHSDKAKQYIVMSSSSSKDNDDVDDGRLALLRKAKEIGSSTHQVLAEEAELAYSILTEDDRSC
jgi:hypothetical protein